MPKRAFIVHPTVHLVKDEQGNTIRSDYSYPPAPNCHAEVLAYNRDKLPPNGDFLQEQMWVLEGPSESLDIFASDPRTQEVHFEDCCVLCEEWDGPKTVKEPIAPGSSTCCPDCGEPLSCPGCGSMAGKTPVVQRQRKGWSSVDHLHYLEGVEKRNLPDA